MEVSKTMENDELGVEGIPIRIEMRSSSIKKIAKC
jgi:hypothetical protein